VHLITAVHCVQSVAVTPSAAASNSPTTTSTTNKLTVLAETPCKIAVKRGKIESLPEWLPQLVFDASLLPHVIDKIGIDSNIWDLEANGKLLSIAQDGINQVILNEDLVIDMFELRTTHWLYRHVSVFCKPCMIHMH
jgi:hypothetical protein